MGSNPAGGAFLYIMDCKNYDEQLVRMLLARLERISSDSYWAHRASGIRGSLLKVLVQYEQGEKVNKSHLKSLLTYGFMFLESAAKESKALRSDIFSE